MGEWKAGQKKRQSEDVLQVTSRPIPLDCLRSDMKCISGASWGEKRGCLDPSPSGPVPPMGQRLDHGPELLHDSRLCLQGPKHRQGGRRAGDWGHGLE